MTGDDAVNELQALLKDNDELFIDDDDMYYVEPVMIAVYKPLSDGDNLNLNELIGVALGWDVTADDSFIFVPDSSGHATAFLMSKLQERIGLTLRYRII